MNFELDQFWIWSFLLMAINYFRGGVYVVSVHGGNIWSFIIQITLELLSLGTWILSEHMSWVWTLQSIVTGQVGSTAIFETHNFCPPGNTSLHVTRLTLFYRLSLVLSWPLKQLTFSGQDSRELYSSCRDYNATFSFPPVGEWMCPVICLHATPWIPTVDNSINSTAVLLGFLKDMLNIFTCELPESSFLFGEDFGGCGSMRNRWAQRQQMERLPRDVSLSAPVLSHVPHIQMSTAHSRSNEQTSEGVQHCELLYSHSPADN